MAEDEAGYTLTEMLVVIGIIAILAAVLTPTLAGQLARARAKAAHMQAETVAAALESYKDDVGQLPDAKAGLTGLVKNPGLPGWLGPYIRDEKALNDPWGRPLLLRPGADSGKGNVVSLGADGKEGGSGPAADIVVPVQ